MKSFKVQLYESNEGPLVGAPDYIVKKAVEADVPLKLILPDGRYMIIDVSKSKFDAKWVAADGQVRDRFVIEK
jgi:hypothetical protein